MRRKDLFIILISLLFILSCNNNEHSDHYYKCFFLGEESFIIEGEITSETPFDIPLYIKLLHYKGPSSTREWKWEISTNVLNNKFKTLININNDEMTSGFREYAEASSKFMWLSFPKNHQVYILGFSLPNDTTYSGYHLYYKGNYEYGYIYVAEPIDLSTTYTDYYDQNFGSTSATFYKDLNFSKTGWYRVMYKKNEKIEDNPNFYTGKDTKLY